MRVGERQVGARREVGGHLHLEAARIDRTGRDLIGDVVRVLAQDARLVDVEAGDAAGDIRPRNGELHAGLQLVAGRRLEGPPVDVGADLRREGGGVARIGHEARRQQVVETDAVGEGGVVLALRVEEGRVRRGVGDAGGP